MKKTILTVAILSWLIVSYRLNGEPLMSNLSESSFLELLGNGGEILIQNQGDALLELLYFKRKPTDAELEKMTFNPPVLKDKKDDLPVFQALKNGGKSTLDMLTTTAFFDYPVHPAELEVIAYLLMDIMGAEKAAQFAKERSVVKDCFRKDNWNQILKMLDDPKIHSGHFIVERFVPGNIKEIQPTLSDLVNERAGFKKLLSEAKTIDSVDAAYNYYHFRKILLAVNKFSFEKRTQPQSLYDLVSENYLPQSALMFTDSESFFYVPRYFYIKQKNDENKEILKLDSPDNKLYFKGYTNNTILAFPIKPTNTK